VRGLRPVRAGRFLTEKAPKAAKLHPIAASERTHDFVENSVDDLLDITLIQLRVLSQDALNKFGFDHQQSARLQSVANPSGFIDSCLLTLVRWVTIEGDGVPSIDEGVGVGDRA
jgi:hypothetical protein